MDDYGANACECDLAFQQVSTQLRCLLLKTDNTIALVFFAKHSET